MTILKTDIVNILEVFTDGVPSDSLDVPLVCEDGINESTTVSSVDSIPKVVVD